MPTITDDARELLEGRNFVHVATLMEDGSPQVTPVWVDVDGDEVLINTAVGRLKDRNLRRDGRVALSLTDPENPYRALTIRGEVVEMIEGDEAERHIDALAKKYLDAEVYPYRQAGERRVKVRIRPERVSLGG